MAELPEIAVITVVRDEADMLPRWIAHYAKQCGSADRLVVIDDNTTDGSTQGLPCPVIRLPDRHQPSWASTRMRMVNALGASLLQSFDAVAFVDADEFLVADPDKYGDLRELLADRPEARALGAMGLNVVHRVGVEEPLRPDLPVLAQRRTAKFIPKMCKPAIKRDAAPWAAGSHGLRAPYEIDPDLYMFHLKFADRDHLAATAAHRQELVEESGRGQNANWKLGDELLSVLDELEVPPLEEVRRFRPLPNVLAKVVEPAGDGVWHSTGRGQVTATRERPLVRIPKRFADAV